MRRILLAIAFLALTTPGLAGVHRWTPIGPEGGNAQQLLADPTRPDVVWALVDGRPFRSTDGGATWTERSAGVPVPGSFGVESLAIDPARPDTLLAAVFGADVYRTTDAGLTWVHVLGRSTLGSRVNLVADPIAPGTFYATPASTLLPLLRSTDHGATWAPVGAAPDPGISSYVVSFAADPATPGQWYLLEYGSGANRLFVTGNAGTTWVQRGAGLPTEFSRLLVTATTPPTLWLYDTGTGLYRSTDGGTTFSQSGLGRKDLVPIAVDPGDPRTMYAIRDDYFQKQFFRSSDAGATWDAVDLRAAGLPTATLTDLVVDPFDGAHLWAGTARDGVLVSTDAGASWTPGITGLPRTRSVCALASTPGGATLHAIADGSLWTSRDGGASWRPNTPDVVPVLSFRAVSGVTIDPTDPDVVYAASSGGVFKSVDGAASWSPSSSGLPAGATMVAVDPLTPRTLYATTASGVYRSLDGGASWALRGPGTFSTLVVDPTSPATIYFDGGLAVSRDGGATSAAPSLIAPFLDPPQGILVTQLLATVAPAPTSPGKVYAGVGATIFEWPRNVSSVASLDVSGDRMATFTNLSSTIAPSALAVDPTDDLALYVGETDRALRSRDGGTTLEPFGAGLGGTPCVFAGGSPGEPLLAGTEATDSTTRAFGVYAIEEPACVADEDCADGAECTTDRCSAGRCTHDAVADGTSCDDPPGGCSDGGRCSAGACRTFRGCDDGDACTTDSCKMPGVCAHERSARCCTSAAQCDDGDACTTDACVATRCVSTVDRGLCPDRPLTSVTIRIVTRDAGSKIILDTSETGVLAPLAGSADDPSLAGATVDLFTVGVPRATWALSAGVGRPGWKVKPAPPPTYVFANPGAPAGSSSVRRLALRVGRHLSLTAVASGDPIATGVVGEVGIRITMGSRRLCALFDGAAIRANKPGRFVARANLLPAGDCTAASFGGEGP